MARYMDQDAGERRRQVLLGLAGPSPSGSCGHVPVCFPSPVQIRVNSSRMIRVTQVDSEEELEKFNMWNVVFSFLKEKLNDTSIDVDLYSNKTCLKVELLEAGTTYCVVLFRRTAPLWRGLLGWELGLAALAHSWGQEDVAGRAHSLRASSAGSFLGKENGPAKRSESSSMGYKVGELRALVGGSPGTLSLPCLCDHTAGWRAPCQGSSQPGLAALIPGFDPKLFLVFFLGLLLFFCGDMLSRWATSLFS